MEMSKVRRTWIGRRTGALAVACLVVSLVVGQGPASAAVLTENFDGVVPPNLPPGWTSTITTAVPADPAWVTTATGTVDTPPNTAFAASPNHVTDSVLVSPVLSIASGGSVTFRNFHDLENTFDGGVLEIKIGAGAFTDILAAGGSFVVGGYNGSLSVNFGNPLAGRQAWTNNSGGFITSTANFPAAADGQNVQLRWRLGTDTSVSDAGWRVDTISIAGIAEACSPEPAPIPGDIVGTPGNDFLGGTPGNDRIFGLGGNDQIDGQGGDDVIFAGAGDDKVSGGAGNDTLCGGPGNDSLSGSTGNDRLFGGDGNDSLSGGDGDDSLAGEAGDDRLTGSAGTNTNDGGPGTDQCLNPAPGTNCSP